MSGEHKGTVVTAVAADNIWKTYVQKVTKNQIQSWPSKWNWIIAENVKMYDAMAGKRPLSPYLYPWERPAQPEASKAKRPSDLDILLPPIPDIPAQPKIPATTTGWYGFLPKVQGRSLVTERQKWCKSTVGQYSLHRQFGWPDIYD